MRKIAIAIAAAFIALSAHAGLLITRDDGVRLSIDGDKVRVDKPKPKDSPVMCNAVISRDGGKTSTCLNTELWTWYESDARDEMLASRRFGAATRHPAVTKVKIDSSDEPNAETIAGHATEKHTIHVSYDLRETIGGVDAKQNITSTLVVWTAPDVPPSPLTRGMHTNFKDVDARLASIFASFKGMVVKESMTVTQRYEGGQPFTDTSNWTTTSIESKKFSPSIFEVPKDYRHELPQWGVPGK